MRCAATPRTATRCSASVCDGVTMRSAPRRQYASASASFATVVGAIHGRCAGSSIDGSPLTSYTTGQPRPAARIGTPAPRVAEMRQLQRAAAREQQVGEPATVRQAALQGRRRGTAEADDLHPARLALRGREPLVAEHVEQPAAERPEQRAREAVDVHRRALGCGEAVERGIRGSAGRPSGCGAGWCHATRRDGRLPWRAVKLVTWNVNSLNVRMPRVLELLAQHEPDIALLQETKTEPDAFPAEALRAAGYHAAHHSAGRWAGVAVLAREPLADVSTGLPGEPSPDEARWIEATAGDLRVASVYVPNGREIGHPEYEKKLAFLDAARERVGSLDVLAGDFNVCPADIDVYDPAAFVGSTHVQPEERARFAALLETGRVDAFRYLHPDDVGFTWWDYRQGHFHRKMGLRIDAFLVGRAAGGRDRGVRHRPQLPQGPEAVRPRAAAAGARLAPSRRRAGARGRAPRCGSSRCRRAARSARRSPRWSRTRGRRRGSPSSAAR